MTKDTRDKLQRFAARIRLETMRQFQARGFGHIGGSFSIADILAVLYGNVMKFDAANPDWEERDYLVLSKGHAGPALYSALALSGFFPMELLLTLNQPGTRIPSHPDRKLTPGVDMTTGSLGQGLSVACGTALAKRLNGSSSKVYAIIGDGECNEGQIWEAALFAGHHKLSNLIVFLDYNGKQLDGKLEDIISLGDLGAKFQEFGFAVCNINGNDVSEISKAVAIAQKEAEKPSLIFCRTIKGAGLSAIEEMPQNHHITIDADFAQHCIAELEALV